MNKATKTIAMAAVLLNLVAGVAMSGTPADFEDLSLPANSYENGASLSGSFTSRGLTFNNQYIPDWGSWSGFAYSNVNDTVTKGYENQYAAFTGTGFGGGGIYGVGYDGGDYGIRPVISLPSGWTARGMYVTNTTYAVLTIRDGDDYGFSKKFGGATGNDPDWFKLTIAGKDSAGAVTGMVDFYLADYRFENNAQDYIVDEWIWLDLSSLGPAARTLTFSLSSSDTGMWGMNTPAYFALDNVTSVPEPGALLALGAGLASLAGAIRRRW